MANKTVELLPDEDVLGRVSFECVIAVTNNVSVPMSGNRR
jgi:hypothetical protein